MRAATRTTRAFPRLPVRDDSAAYRIGRGLAVQPLPERQPATHGRRLLLLLHNEAITTGPPAIIRHERPAGRAAPRIT